jgi:hypothetical protein
MRRLVHIFIFSSIGFLLSCETRSSFNPPDESYFLKYFGNSGNQEGVDFVVNTDGTYVLLGNSRATPDSDQQVYVAKADAKGNLIWEKTFGGKYDEEAKDIELLPDGNLILLANSANNSSIDPAIRERDVMLIKLGQDGSKMDSVKQGLTSTSNNVGGLPNDEDSRSISIINNGFIVAGSSGPVPQQLVDKFTFMHMRFKNDLTWVSDIDVSGWKNKYAFAKAESGESKTVKVFQESSGFFYGIGYTNKTSSTVAPTADFDFCIYEIGPEAVEVGIITIGDDAIDEKLFSVSSIPPQSGAGYFLSGSSQSSSNGDVYFVQIPQSLNIGNPFDPINVNFKKTLGENLVNASFLSAYNAPSSFSDIFFIATEKGGADGSSNIYFSKWQKKGGKDSSGEYFPLEELLEQPLGGIGNDFAGPVVELPDGHIAMIGTFTLGGVVDGQKKIVFIKLNKEGRLAP